MRLAMLPPAPYAPPAPRPPMMAAAPTELPRKPVSAPAAAALPPTVVRAVPAMAASAGAARPPAQNRAQMDATHLSVDNMALTCMCMR